MQSIADLFTYVYEKRKKEKAAAGKSAKNSLGASGTSGNSLGVGPSTALSFSPAKGEEFSEDKVNEAWNSTIPITNEIVGSSTHERSTHEISTHERSTLGFGATASSTASPSLSSGFRMWRHPSA